MRIILGRILFHPFVLSFFNFALLLLAYSALKETWFRSASGSHDIHLVTELWEGYGTIILGFGVALEEKKKLRKIFTIKEKEDKFEEICHDYGVIFVMLGVIIELFAWFVRIPNEVLNTENVEMFFIHSAAVTAAIAAILQIRFFYHLVAKWVDLT